MQSRTIIITAGGIGKRMGSELPKQFIEVCGKPILQHTLEAFFSYDNTLQIILTLPEEWKDYWKETLQNQQCTIPHLIVSGGEERYHSIKNALAHATGEWIGVHDGVRPLVSRETIERCFLALEHEQAAIPVLKPKESIRKIIDATSQKEDRELIRLVQTPQCFRAETLRKAYEKPFHAGVTDDAGLVEEAGFPIFLVEGNEENIKITTPFDLQITTFLLQQL